MASIPHTDAAMPSRISGHISSPTPENPGTTLPALSAVMRSSRVRIWASRMVKIGVVA